jgi:hypothetical protein
MNKFEECPKGSFGRLRTPALSMPGGRGLEEWKGFAQYTNYYLWAIYNNYNARAPYEVYYDSYFDNASEHWTKNRT